jgi:quinol monooxygenase YgiN
MPFIQIVDFETDRPEQMRALADQMRSSNMNPRWSRLTTTHDHNNPQHYATIVEFPSWEAAQASNEDPQVQSFAQQMGQLCTKGPSFINLDVEESMP